MDNSLVSMKRAGELTSLSRSTIYRRVAEGRFPLPVALGGGRVAFRRTEIERWLRDPLSYLRE
jgi:excisionase family DNA binding protein